MSPREAYEIYRSVRLHFEAEKFDAIKYNFKVAGRGRHIQNETAGDQLMFVRLAKKFPIRQNLIDFCVAYCVHFAKGNYYVLGMLKPEAMDVYRDWMRRRDSMTYQFKGAMQFLGNHWTLDKLLTIDDTGMPPIIRCAMHGNLDGDITLAVEHVVILDMLTNFMDDANRIIRDKIFWPDFYLKVKKYRAFMTHIDKKKYREIVLQAFTDQRNVLV